VEDATPIASSPSEYRSQRSPDYWAVSPHNDLWQRNEWSPRRSTSRSSGEIASSSTSYFRLGQSSYPSSSQSTSRYDSDFTTIKNERNRWAALLDIDTSNDRSPSPIDPDELQIVAELKPRQLRTPELVEVEDDDVDRKPSAADLTIAIDDGPSTSGTSRERDGSTSKERKRHEHRSHKHRHHRHHDGHKKKKSKKEKKSKRHHRKRDRDRTRSKSRSKSPLRSISRGGKDVQKETRSSGHRSV